MNDRTYSEMCVALKRAEAGLRSFEESGRQVQIQLARMVESFTRPTEAQRCSKIAGAHEC